MFFSVIVPVYQVEDYLEKCLDSILAQTFGDFELIVVDDGSPDGCGAICDAYARKDPRVTAVHKENGGLVSARKAGMRLASGEYVIHVDSDDAIAPDFLRKSYDIIQKTQADILSFSISYCHPEGTVDTIHEPALPGLYDRKRFMEVLYPSILLTEDMHHSFYYLCGKVFRRTLVAPLQELVDDRTGQGEDISVLIPAYFEARQVYIDHTPMYLCTVRSGSMSRAFKMHQFLSLELVVERLKALKGVPEDFACQIARYGAFMCFVMLVSAAQCGLSAPERRQLCLELRRPVLRQQILDARFSGITLKSRIAMFLMKRDMTVPAYRFLKLCHHIKNGFGRK